ncbi:hypothetical protein BGX27_009901 [Mortierella sp. AM989]|nr:hypothetical protein BGX27_009901 [Mortierella sp. AM989]
MSHNRPSSTMPSKRASPGSPGSSETDSPIGTSPNSTLKRDASLIIPSMIPTQEVLRNINHYRGNGMIQLGGDEDENDSDEDKVSEVSQRDHRKIRRESARDDDFVLSTYNDDPSPLIQYAKPTPSTPMRSQTTVSNANQQTVQITLQPLESPSILRTYSRKRAITPPPAQPQLRREDSDPIMDFDDSSEEGSTYLKRDPTERSVSPAVSTPSRRTPFVPPRSFTKAQNGSPRSPHTHRPLAPPESPSRRFIIPLATQPIRGNGRHSTTSPTVSPMKIIDERPAPNSPSKRLRPLSEIQRPVAPLHLQFQRSPSRKGAGTVSNMSPRKQRVVTSPSSSKTPTRAATTRSAPMAKSLEVIRPPAALGPQLQQIADEARDEYEQEEEEEEDKLIRRRPGKDKEQYEPANESLFLGESGLALMTSDFYSESQAKSPELEFGRDPSSRLESKVAEQLSPTSSPTSAMELKRKVLESPFLVPDPGASSPSRHSNVIYIKKEEPLTPMLVIPEELLEVTSRRKVEPIEEVWISRIPRHLQQQKQQRQRQQRPPPSPPPPPLQQQQQKIPLPGLILEYASKLTPLDTIKWPPAKVGRFHILALVIFVGTEEQVVTKKRQTVMKREITVCDQSATSFKLNLWGDCCKWADSQFKVGDAVLITDVHTSEFRQKIAGSTSGWSRVARLDGTILGLYQGHDTIESYMKIFIEKRRVLALNLLDKSKGIARDPSLYLTHNMWTIPGEVATGGNTVFTTDDNLDGAGHHDSTVGNGKDGGSRPQKPVNGLKGPGLMALLSTASSMIHGTHSTKPSGNGDFVPSSMSSTTSSESRMSTPSTSSTVTGASIRASVVYKALIVPGDESQGWEIGVVMQNGRSVTIHCDNTPSWISDTSPGRVLVFFGRFKERSDIFYIDASSREPSLLRESSWDDSLKNVKARKFQSIKSLREHKFMGDATLDAYILAISSPDFILDDRDERAMYDFIQCYCTECQSIAVSSPQNPSIMFCRECHLDPQKRNQPLEWRYPAFEISLGDKPRMGANLTSESLQLRCHPEIGDQVFLSVPARRWMQDEEGFWESRKRWKRLVELMNKQGESIDSDDEERSGPSDNIPQKIRVEVMVGVNMMVKALKVDYL